MLAGPGVAAEPRVPPLDREGAETPQFDTIASRQGVGDFIEARVYDLFDITQIKMRVAIGNPLDELRCDHSRRLLKKLRPRKPKSRPRQAPPMDEPRLFRRASLRRRSGTSRFP